MVEYRGQGSGEWQTLQSQARFGIGVQVLYQCIDALQELRVSNSNTNTCHMYMHMYMCMYM